MKVRNAPLKIASFAGLTFAIFCVMPLFLLFVLIGAPGDARQQKPGTARNG